MIFKKSYRAIELSNDYTIQELCDQLNSISNSNLYSTIHNDRIIVKKKYFSDFFPFNFGHLGSMTLHAKSAEIESESDKLNFIIEMKDLVKFSTFGSIILLVGFSVLALLSLEIGIGGVVLIFTIIAILWSNVIHNYGIANFTKNWDEHIGTKV